jgi:hypothetical protein
MSLFAFNASHGLDYVRLPGDPKPTSGWMPPHRTVRVNDNVTVHNGPLPICPECKDTKHVVNAYKGPNPPFLECSECKVEWNSAGQVNFTIRP